MCQLKSGIILKDRVFVPEYDSHTDMLEELKIEDNYLNASKTFVRVELSPKNGNVFSDIDTWVLNVDQDIMPDWYDEETYKPQVVEAVKKWMKDHIHIGVDNLKIDSAQIIILKIAKMLLSTAMQRLRISATMQRLSISTAMQRLRISTAMQRLRMQKVRQQLSVHLTGGEIKTL